MTTMPRRYKIMQMPGSRARRNAQRNYGAWHSPPPKNRGEVVAKSGEDALKQFAHDMLGEQYTCREFRPEQRYAPAFLVARCWNGARNHHEVRFEAWREDR